MKKILGLDLGTNSIGWAVVEIDHELKIVRIIALGSRILPMDAGEISKFENGAKLKSSAAERTGSKSIRKNISRFLLRRDRLHCVLNLLNALPEHYKLDIDFVNKKGKRSGKIKEGKEPKLAYYIDEKGRSRFYFTDAYEEMEKEFKAIHPELFYTNSRTKEQTKIPYDWTLYYLRKKGLTQELKKEELAWVTMSFLQKRGYEKVMGLDEKEQKEGELSEIINAKVASVEPLNEKSSDGLNKYHIKLSNEYGNIVFEYDEEALSQITQKDDLKQIEKVSKLDPNDDGNIKNIEYIISEIKNIEITNIVNKFEKKKDQTKYEIELSTGWSYEYTSKYTPKFKGEKRDFIISCSYLENGKLKKRTIKMPSADDWQLEKLKTETSIHSFNLRNQTCGVASYIYDALIHNPNQKIKAGLVTTIERNFYKEELKKILEFQKQFHPELEDVQKYKDALWLLYPNNEAHRNALAKQNFSTLLTDDIIFYQRDLKTKKSLINNCPYEFRIDKEGKKHPIKCTSKSNPLYQEFRLWQFIKRLKIIKREDVNGEEKYINQDVTETVLTAQVKEELFSYLKDKKEIAQDALLKKIFHKKNEYTEYKWNFEEDHKEPCNETRYDFVLRLKRIRGFHYDEFLDAKAKTHEPDGRKNKSNILIDGCSNEYLLWHFFYSVKKKDERVKGLPCLVEKLLKNANMDLSYRDNIVEMLSSISTYKNAYGTYSEKAIKKLLPFMRLGKYWSEKDVESINTSDNIKAKVLEKENIQGETKDLQGLWLSSACYIVYGKYSEAGEAKQWTQPNDILDYLEKEFKHNSLNNPVVEKVVREMLYVVHDIWTTFGHIDGCYTDENGKEIKTYKKYFDQINIEIGTQLKKNNKEKESDTKRNKDNRLANERAFALLKELKSVYKGAGIKEKSPFQQEKLKILEAGIVDAIKYDKDDKKYEYKTETSEKEFSKKDIKELLKKEVSEISKKDIERYRLWLEQRYLSPYTGKPISLSNLFDRTKYEIEHIFPQERVTLNSYKNKVICETIVNKAKGAMTGYEFILKSNGKCIYQEKEIKLLNPNEYVEHVQRNITDEDKQEILLSKDIPNQFGNNQMNNSRHIAKLAMTLLSNIVREEDEKEAKSKNVLVISGGVTAILKHDWKLDEAWNELIKPRFIRMNELLETNDFGEERIINGHSIFVPTIPNNDINKKRIDHRHHALDALIIALATSNHVNYINNISSLDINSDRRDERRDLKTKYMGKRKNSDESEEHYFLPPMQYKQSGTTVTYKYAYKDNEPQIIFKEAVLDALQNTLVTFKQKNRIMRQRMNVIQHPDYEEGRKEENLNMKKNYNVRQSLHKATFYGRRNIMPKPIEEAIKESDRIVENSVKLIIRKYFQEGKDRDQIISELKKTNSVVYVREDCATTQWSHSLDYFAQKEESTIIKEIECIADITIQNILKKHLAKYDSIKIPIGDAAKYYDDIVTDAQKELVKKYESTGESDGTDVKIDVYVRNINTEDGQIMHNPQIAFSADGIKDLNDCIVDLNNGKKHKPIYKIQMIQALGKKFSISSINKDTNENTPTETVKDKQLVISDAGSNNFCGFYKSENGGTKIFVPTLRDYIKTVKASENLFPSTTVWGNEEYKLKFVLSPLDLVYMPTEDEIINDYLSNEIDFSRIFVVNDFEGEKIYFRPYNIAQEIGEHEIDLQKDSSGNLQGSRILKTANCGNRKIRDYCIPIKVDRLGNIIELNGKKI